MTTSKSKAKGTGGEREVLGILKTFFPGLRRTPASSRVDLEQNRPGGGEGDKGDVLRILATRADRGPWLYTIDERTLRSLVAGDAHTLSIAHVFVEVKRYKKTALDRIWRDKFGNVGRKNIQRKESEERILPVDQRAEGEGWDC